MRNRFLEASCLLVLFVVTFIPLPTQAQSGERAGGEALATATGHYARARSHLIAAIREFDKGYSLVDPSALIDPALFRAKLLESATELERVLDPQPRVTNKGARFEPDSRLMGEAN